MLASEYFWFIQFERFEIRKLKGVYLHKKPPIKFHDKATCLAVSSELDNEHILPIPFVAMIDSWSSTHPRRLDVCHRVSTLLWVSLRYLDIFDQSACPFIDTASRLCVAALSFWPQDRGLSILHAYAFLTPCLGCIKTYMVSVWNVTNAISRTFRTKNSHVIRKAKAGNFEVAS